MSFRFVRSDIPDVVLICPQALEDARGFFMESYKHSDFASHGIPQPFLQINRSHSLQGVLRGLHYQLPPKAQGKLISVVGGTVFDVAVDLRKGSPTYRRWVAMTLSAQEHELLYVPVGFAHGFCVVSEEADVLYYVTEEYAPEADRGIRWDDPDLAIPWPIQRPTVSLKDSQWPRLLETETGFTYPILQP